MSEETSEFGKGFTYCMALFIAHKERLVFDKFYSTKEFQSTCWFLWFDGAVDHLRQMEIPEGLPAPLKRRLASWRKECMRMKYHPEETSRRKVNWAIKRAIRLLMDVDIELGVKPIKGEYE